MYTCITKSVDDHRSCQKLINCITNTKAITRRYYCIQKFPVLYRLFIQHLCINNKSIGKENSIPCCQVVFSIVDRSQFWNLKYKELSSLFFQMICKHYTLLHWKCKCTEYIVIDSVIRHAKEELTTILCVASVFY